MNITKNQHVFSNVLKRLSVKRLTTFPNVWCQMLENLSHSDLFQTFGTKRLSMFEIAYWEFANKKGGVTLSICDLNRHFRKFNYIIKLNKISYTVIYLNYLINNLRFSNIR